jgi:hypothetical protein
MIKKITESFFTAVAPPIKKDSILFICSIGTPSNGLKSFQSKTNKPLGKEPTIVVKA